VILKDAEDLKTASYKHSKSHLGTFAQSTMRMTSRLLHTVQVCSQYDTKLKKYLHQRFSQMHV
jgi:hypothetical protein